MVVHLAQVRRDHRTILRHGGNTDGNPLDAGLGHTASMTKPEDEPDIAVDEPPNTRPGQTDQGGHGGMATREQGQRLYEEQHAEPDTG